jgi:catechol 2,3-dioxygenase-like lactoylglutathione lyase family enzyme
MLVRGKVHPTLSVTDLERARKFYGGTLELAANGEPVEGHVMYEAG